MATHYLIMKDEHEFYQKLKNRDFDLINKMVKCVLNAIKRKKDKIDVFEVTFKNKGILVFTLEKDQYSDVLNNCLNDFIKIEDYETCIEIQKILKKRKLGANMELIGM